MSDPRNPYPILGQWPAQTVPVLLVPKPATILADCPQCGAPTGAPCVLPSGRPANIPHGQRSNLDPRDATIAALRAEVEGLRAALECAYALITGELGSQWADYHAKDFEIISAALKEPK